MPTLEGTSTTTTTNIIKANPNEASTPTKTMSMKKVGGKSGGGGHGNGGRNSKQQNGRSRRLFVDEYDSQVASFAGIISAQEEDDDILSNLDLPLVNSRDFVCGSRSGTNTSASHSSYGGGDAASRSRSSAASNHSDHFENKLSDDVSGGDRSASKATDTTLTPQTTFVNAAAAAGEQAAKDTDGTNQMELIRRILEEIRTAMTEQQQLQLEQMKAASGGGGAVGSNVAEMAAAAASAVSSAKVPNDIDMAMLADPKNWDKLFRDRKAQERLLEVFHDSNEELPIHEVVIPPEEGDVEDGDFFNSPQSPSKKWQRRWSMCSDITGFAELDVVDMAERDIADDAVYYGAAGDVGEEVSPDLLSPSPSTKSKVSGKAAKRRSSKRRSSIAGGKKRNSSNKGSSEFQASDHQQELHPSELFPGAEDYMERMGDMMVEARRQSLTHVEGDDEVNSISTPPTSIRSNGSSKSGSRLRHSSPNIARSGNNPVDTVGAALASTSIQRIPLTNAFRNGSKPNSKGKSVDFSSVTIRHYERIVGDNPACVHGPPIGIGWKYKSYETRRGDSSRCIIDVSISSGELCRSSHHSLSNMKSNKYLYSVQEFEELRHNQRLSGPELVLTRPEREQLLMDWGYTAQDLAKAVRVNRAAQNKRRQTINNLGAAPMEEAMESVSRKVRSLLGFRKLAVTPSTASAAATFQQRSA